MEPWGSSVKQDSNMLLQHVHVLCMFIFPGTVSYNPRVWAGSVAWRGTEEGSGQSLLQHVQCYLVNHELDSPVYESSDKTGYVRGLINSNGKPVDESRICCDCGRKCRKSGRVKRYRRARCRHTWYRQQINCTFKMTHIPIPCNCRGSCVLWNLCYFYRIRIIIVIWLGLIKHQICSFVLDLWEVCLHP